MDSNIEVMPKKPSASWTAMTEYVLPTHANVLGNVFGGQVLSWMDLCAAICAQRHTGHIAVTAGIDDLSFEQSIKVGEVVHVTARVTAAFRTSMEILVTVSGEDSLTGKTWPCVSAFMTFVAVDAERKPARVSPLLPENDEDIALAQAAAERRAQRLSKRAAAKT